MKRLSTTTIIISLLIACTISCKKKKHDPDPQAPTVSIEIIAPSEHAAYHKLDTVWMKAHISYENELHGYELHLLRLADTVEVFSYDEDVHAKSFDVQQYWINDGKVHSDMLLTFIANIDHNGTKATKTVQFHCHTD